MTNLYANDFTTTVKTYYDELKKYKPISRSKERELICKAKNGDIDSQNELITANLRFVFNIASKYKGNSVPIADLISEGNLGLIKAIHKFDPKRNVKFISYAVWWVRNSIQEFIKKRQSSIMFEKNEDSLINPFNEAKLKDIEDDYTTMGEFIESNEEDEETRELYRAQKETIEMLLSKLSKRERLIIEKYYGINGPEKNLEEIGNELGLTKERIRQIKFSGINKLRSEILLLDISDLFS